MAKSKNKQRSVRDQRLEVAEINIGTRDTLAGDIAKMRCKRDGTKDTKPTDSDKLVAGILLQRGYDPKNKEAIEEFLYPPDFADFQKRYLHGEKGGLFTMKDVETAANKLVDAIETASEDHQIGISGDYDCDGNCSVALLRRFLIDCGVEKELIHIHVPNREEEGYGINQQAVNEFHTNEVKSLFILDNGTVAYEPVKKAGEEYGMQVVVCDHHQNKEGSPPLKGCAALVNPNQYLDKGKKEQQTLMEKGVGDLAAVGVTFLVCACARDILKNKRKDMVKAVPDMRKYLGLVALATVGDVVNLSSSVNRALVTEGLKVINASEDPYITSFAKYAGFSFGNDNERKEDKSKRGGDVNEEDIAFRLAPIINAPGRLGQSVAWEFLSKEGHKSEVEAILSERVNDDRKELEHKVLRKALEQVNEQVKASMPVLFALIEPDKIEKTHDNMDDAEKKAQIEGVIGIVAGRLKEEYHRPVVVAARVDKETDGEIQSFYKCSARSVKVPGYPVDIGKAFLELGPQGEEVLSKAGGHAMAAGATCMPEKWEDFKVRLTEKLNKAVEKARKHDRVEVIGEASEKRLKPKNRRIMIGGWVDAIERLRPFGEGHARPKILLKDFMYSKGGVSRNGRDWDLRLNTGLILDTLLSRESGEGDGITIPGKAFRAVGMKLGEAIHHKQHDKSGLLVTLRRDRKGDLTFHLEDIQPSPPFAEKEQEKDSDKQLGVFEGLECMQAQKSHSKGR